MRRVIVVLFEYTVYYGMIKFIINLLSHFVTPTPPTTQETHSQNFNKYIEDLFNLDEHNVVTQRIGRKRKLYIRNGTIWEKNIISTWIKIIKKWGSVKIFMYESRINPTRSLSLNFFSKITSSKYWIYSASHSEYRRNYTFYALRPICWIGKVG